jgi:WD40-like Beta Propeller Repeat
MIRRLTAAALAAAAIVICATQLAAADVFQAASLLSTSATEQAVYAHDPAVSADGRYVVFDGDYDGLTGVWRRAVAGGPVEAVAAGLSQSPQGSAELPSVSADGRYVSFTTTARLDPFDDTNEGPDVYVRDMDEPDAGPCAPPSVEEESLGSRPPCAFTLASARDGSRAGLDYSYGSDRSIEEHAYGSIAAGRSALSADGTKVAFITTSVSDLDGAGTPSLQVAVRDTSNDTTQLVSARYDPASGSPAVDPGTGGPEPVGAQQGSETYGAVFTGSGGRAPFFRAPQPREAPAPVGASISADGSTVAWMATNIAQQAPMLSGESQPPAYAEPLWRRIADGPQAPAHRITGGSDPASPGCQASGETALASPASLSDPCQGPLATLTTPSTPGVVTGLEGDDDVIPALSADGYTVAFVSNAPPVALSGEFGLGGGQHTDLYTVSMRPGLTRRQALRPLTELASGDLTDLATTAPIVDLAVSADGSQVAFTTKRTQFPLGVPAYVTAPGVSAGMLELFDADLGDETVTRVSAGFEGGVSEHPHPVTAAGEDPYGSADDGALSPSFSGDGNTIVFSSTASNLVYGDGNTPPAVEPDGPFDGSDVFAASRVVFGSAAAPQYVGSPPSLQLPAPQWLLGVTAVSRADGSVVLEADVPGAGTLKASARATALARRARDARKSSRRRRSRAAATVTVASAGARVVKDTIATLRMRPGGAYAALATRKQGLKAIVTVTFAAPGHATLRRQLTVTFRRRAVQSRKRRA